jgi:hypothetical protein
MFKVTIRSLGWMASQTPKPTMWPLVNFTGRSAAPIRSRITLSDRDWSAASAQASLPFWATAGIAALVG